MKILYTQAFNFLLGKIMKKVSKKGVLSRYIHKRGLKYLNSKFFLFIHPMSFETLKTPDSD